MMLEKLEQRLQLLINEQSKAQGNIARLKDDLKLAEQNFQNIVGHVNEARFWVEEARKNLESQPLPVEAELVSSEGVHDGQAQ